jgi:outer membrane protein
MNRFIPLLLLLLPAFAAAESPWRLGVAMGYGERSNPLLNSDDLPIVVDVDIAYFGKRFFFDNGDVGLTFADNDRVTASVMARVRSDRVFFGRTNTRFVNIGSTGQALESPVEVEPPDRDYAAEAGVEFLSDGRWGYLQLNAFHDISGTHNGYELDLDYGVGFRAGRWYLRPSLGLSYKSADLNNYYWGVRPDEANEALPAYEAGAGINTRVRLAANYYFSRNWMLTLSGEYERLNDEAAGSPIVSEQAVLGYFAGFGYRF